MNVAWAPADEVPYPTTSLAAAGVADVTPPPLLAALAATLRPRSIGGSATGSRGVRAAWLARAAGLGTAVELRLGEELVRGRLLDVDATGALLLEQARARSARFRRARWSLG